MLTNEPRLNTSSTQDVQILVVDNDRDSRDLYACLLESDVVKVTSLGSIKEALLFLDLCIPALLICEMRFLGESVYPLTQQIRSLALRSGKTIPILVTSTFSPSSFAQQLNLKVEAYLLKPIDIYSFVAAVGNLILLSSLSIPLLEG